jgi:GNAT superfamily N-acetyltransferase
VPEPLIRDVQPADHDAWLVLYAGYREFYELGSDARVVETVWDWVLNGTYSMRGLVAEDGGAVIAIANLHVVPRPAAARTGLYLDDLFTAPAARGLGAGAALLARAAQQAAEEGHALVRWITASDNATARRLYDEHASATTWITYDMPPARL